MKREHLDDLKELTEADNIRRVVSPYSNFLQCTFCETFQAPDEYGVKHHILKNHIEYFEANRFKPDGKLNQAIDAQYNNLLEHEEFRDYELYEESFQKPKNRKRRKSTRPLKQLYASLDQDTFEDEDFETPLNSDIQSDSLFSKTQSDKSSKSDTTKATIDSRSPIVFNCSTGTGFQAQLQPPLPYVPLEMKIFAPLFTMDNDPQLIGEMQISNPIPHGRFLLVPAGPQGFREDCNLPLVEFKLRELSTS